MEMKGWALDLRVGDRIIYENTKMRVIKITQNRTKTGTLSNIIIRLRAGKNINSVVCPPHQHIHIYRNNLRDDWWK